MGGAQEILEQVSYSTGGCDGSTIISPCNGNIKSTPRQRPGEQWTLVGNDVKPWLTSYNRNIPHQGKMLQQELGELMPLAALFFHKSENVTKSTSHQLQGVLNYNIKIRQQ